MKEYISSAKNVDTAINDGLLALGLNRDEVDIKILETGGLFKKAKVCLMYEEHKSEPIIETAQPEAEIVNEEHNVEESTIEAQIEAEPQIEDLEVKVKKELISPDQLMERVSTFLVELAKNMEITATVSYTISENNINFELNGKNIGKMIGYRGETLAAIQTLLGALKQSGEGRYRLYLDIADYKKSREQTIVDLANKMADKAEEIERNVHLDPMTPYERRIVHATLQSRELVETESMGEGEKRHVVIKFKR